MKTKTNILAAAVIPAATLFAMPAANAGVAAELRQAMTGHLDSDSHKLYTHHNFETLRTAVDRLPGLSE